MADTTVTIKQDGTGDYTTIGSAESASDVSSGYYKMEIQDSGSYNESISLSPNTGTPTSSNYMWLTVSSGNRHSGVGASSGHARLHSNSGSYVLASSADYSRIEYLDIEQTGTGDGVNINDHGNLISRCIVRHHGTSGQYVPGIKIRPTSVGAAIDNCLIYNFRGYGIEYEAVGTENFYVDYCTIANCGHGYQYANVRLQGSVTTHFYNNALGDGNLSDIMALNSSPTHSGSHNAWDTVTSYFAGSGGSYTSNQDISSGGVTTTTTTANAMIVTNLTSGSQNYTPVVATGSGSNLLLGNGTNRIGSEPDSRQDFSTDIRGAVRPTKAGSIDIGAFQITIAPASFKYYNGSAFVDASAVQYYNGSAWVDVSGIQYYNGSAWTDPS